MKFKDGLFVGLAATYGMTQFQNRYGKAIQEAFSFIDQKWKREEEKSSSSSKESAEESEEKSEPSTVTVANRVYRAIANEDIPDAKKTAAGQAVHYGFGTSLGLAYVLFTHSRNSKIQSGLKTGILFGGAVWLFADEMMLWGLGLSKAPVKNPPSSHLYGLVSHLVFGAFVGLGSKALEELKSLATERKAAA